MRKLKHSVLIVSIAAALIIFGASIALGYRHGLNIGLIVGAFAFLILIVCMLVVNYKEKRK